MIDTFGDLHMCRSTKTQGTMLPGIILILLIAAWFPLKLQAQTTNQIASLKVALLPILDTFPYYVAEAKGYFEAYALNVIRNRSKSRGTSDE
jgi:ABC-type nitrate/sulfonate/bicarbonate transport system substrate-binding protein